jgi:hypothetical protein
LSAELRRIAGKQLTLAIRELRSVGDPQRDDAVHEARRHVKKTRALLRLLQSALGDSFRASNRRLRLASRLLAPIADGEAVVDTVDRIGARYRRGVPRATVAALRSALLEREARIDRKATRDRSLKRAADLLRAERRHIAGATLNARGFDAIAPGLERSVRRLRHTAARAHGEPSADAYHRWRRRAKDVWLQARLLEGRCARTLLADEKRLDALDGCLGEHHNVVLLERILIAEPLLSRRRTAQWLRILRRYRATLRRRAAALARTVDEEKPRAFVRRVRRLWRKAKQTPGAARPPWPHAA